MNIELEKEERTEVQNENKILLFLNRWKFLILSTLIMIFFSEKMYWYIQGYSLLILVLFYIVGVYIIVRLIEIFKVSNFWPFVLIAITYPLYIEGFFTGIIVADITFITMLSYFIGWHTLLSVILGWYFHRKWLIKKEYKKILLSSIFLGIFWGVWSIVYWTARQIADPDFQDGFKVGQWPVEEFLMLTIVFSVLYMGSHYLLGRKKIWQEEFKASKIEDIIIALIILFFLLIQIISYSYLVVIILGHSAVIVLTLLYYKKRKTSNEKTILQQLAGKVELKGIIIFSIIPILASGVYGLLTHIRPSDEFIDSVIYDGIVAIQVILGFIIYVIALVYTFKRRYHKNEDKANET